MRVALVTDWIMGFPEERVIEAVAEIFPEAELFSSYFKPGVLSPELLIRKRHPSSLQKKIKKTWDLASYERGIPRFLREFSFEDFNLVISFSYSSGHQVQHPAHVCVPLSKRKAFSKIFPRATLWSQGIRFFNADTWLETEVEGSVFSDLNPYFPKNETLLERSPGRFFLWMGSSDRSSELGAWAEVFHRQGRHLVVMGMDRFRARFQKRYFESIDFISRPSDSTLTDLWKKCRGVIVSSGEEGFWNAVDAMGRGIPVILPKSRHNLPRAWIYDPESDSKEKILDSFEKRKEISQDPLWTRFDFQKKFLSRLRSEFSQNNELGTLDWESVLL